VPHRAYRTNTDGVRFGSSTPRGFRRAMLNYVNCSELCVPLARV